MIWIDCICPFYVYFVYFWSCVFKCLSFFFVFVADFACHYKQDDSVLTSPQLIHRCSVSVRRQPLPNSLYIHISLSIYLYLSCIMHRISIRKSWTRIRNWPENVPRPRTRPCTISNAFELQQPPATPSSGISAGSLGQLNEGNENEHAKDARNGNEVMLWHGRTPSFQNSNFQPSPSQK